MGGWRKLAFGSVGVLGVAACGLVLVVLADHGVQQASTWAGVVAALAGVAAAAAAIWPLVVRRSNALPSPRLGVPEWAVNRPVEVSAVVAALMDGRSKTVGITTALEGAGGFGKTTLAMMVCGDSRVLRRFRDYVYWVTIGQGVRATAAIAAKVNDVIRLVTGEEAAFTDPGAAGQRLGALLEAGPRRLLVIDDVWTPEQLAPFVMGGQQCARLVTTRDPGLLGEHGVTVRVGQMSREQSEDVVTSALPPLEASVLEGMLAVAGRWPLLLRLMNKILVNAVQAGVDVNAAATALTAQLRAGGPAAVDVLSAESAGSLQVTEPQERARAVGATIEASTSLLDPMDVTRFAELGVFAEDESIPFSLVVCFWGATGDVDELRAAQLIARLDELALVTRSEDGEEFGMHDEFRKFLRGGLGAARLAALNSELIDGLAEGLHVDGPSGAVAHAASPVEWWRLAPGDHYVRNHLIWHLCEARRVPEAEAVACDLRWVAARLVESGPAAPVADLLLVGTARAERLAALLSREAHLLAPTEPVSAVIDVLHTRVADDPDWGPQVVALRNACTGLTLASRWPMPDLADSHALRGLAGHGGGVEAVAIGPDGDWLATGSHGGLRIWDVATWQEQAFIQGKDPRVFAIAVAPDGSWLAIGGYGEVRILDVATWTERAVLTGHHGSVDAVAIAPDGSWLAAGDGLAGEVRIWDSATWRVRAVLAGHKEAVNAAAAAPDGAWLVTGGNDGTARIWDTATWQERAALTGHDGWVRAIAVAPDSSWLVTGDGGGNVRTWDAETWQQLYARSHGRVMAADDIFAVAVAPDSSWFVSASRDGTAVIWNDLRTWGSRATLTCHARAIACLAVSPDGSWLVTGGYQDGTARVWAVTSHGSVRTLDEHFVYRQHVLTGYEHRVNTLVVAPDGTWLATGSDDQTARVWDAATGQELAALTGPNPHVDAVFVKGNLEWSVLTGHDGAVETMAVAPDGSWLATGGYRKVRVWDSQTWRERAVLTTSPRSVEAVTVAPDCSWLAIADKEDDSDTGTVRIWDTATWQERAELADTFGRLATAVLAVAPDGSWLASGGGERVRIWDTATWQERGALTTHDHGVSAMAIAPDSSWLATTGRYYRTAVGMVRIWDTATWQERAALTTHDHGDTVMTVAPNGAWMATSNRWRMADNVLRIWDTATWRERSVSTGHRGGVNALAVTPDGSWLAVVGNDATLRILNTSTWKAEAQMRFEHQIDLCAWLSNTALALIGAAGLYVFDLP